MKKIKRILAFVLAMVMVFNRIPSLEIVAEDGVEVVDIELDVSSDYFYINTSKINRISASNFYEWVDNNKTYSTFDIQKNDSYYVSIKEEDGYVYITKSEDSDEYVIAKAYMDYTWIDGSRGNYIGFNHLHYSENKEEIKSIKIDFNEDNLGDVYTKDSSLMFISDYGYTFNCVDEDENPILISNAVKYERDYNVNKFYFSNYFETYTIKNIESGNITFQVNLSEFNNPYENITNFYTPRLKENVKTFKISTDKVNVIAKDEFFNWLGTDTIELAYNYDIDIAIDVIGEYVYITTTTQDEYYSQNYFWFISKDENNSLFSNNIYSSGYKYIEDLSSGVVVNKAESIVFIKEASNLEVKFVDENNTPLVDRQYYNGWSTSYDNDEVVDVYDFSLVYNTYTLKSSEVVDDVQILTFQVSSSEKNNIYELSNDYKIELLEESEEFIIFSGSTEKRIRSMQDIELNEGGFYIYEGVNKIPVSKLKEYLGVDSIGIETSYSDLVVDVVGDYVYIITEYCGYHSLGTWSGNDDCLNTEHYKYFCTKNNDNKLSFVKLDLDDEMVVHLELKVGDIITGVERFIALSNPLADSYDVKFFFEDGTSVPFNVGGVEFLSDTDLVNFNFTNFFNKYTVKSINIVDDVCTVNFEVLYSDLNVEAFELVTINSEDKLLVIDSNMGRMLKDDFYSWLGTNTIEFAYSYQSDYIDIYELGDYIYFDTSGYCKVALLSKVSGNLLEINEVFVCSDGEEKYPCKYIGSSYTIGDVLKEGYYVLDDNPNLAGYLINVTDENGNSVSQYCELTNRYGYDYVMCYIDDAYDNYTLTDMTIEDDFCVLHLVVNSEEFNRNIDIEFGILKTLELEPNKSFEIDLRYKWKLYKDDFRDYMLNTEFRDANGFPEVDRESCNYTLGGDGVITDCGNYYLIDSLDNPNAILVPISAQLEDATTVKLELAVIDDLITNDSNSSLYYGKDIKFKQLEIGTEFNSGDILYHRYFDDYITGIEMGEYVPLSPSIHSLDVKVIHHNKDMTSRVEISQDSAGYNSNVYSSVPTCTILYTKLGGYFSKYKVKSFDGTKLVIDAISHKYKNPVFHWGSNYESCTASFDCIGGDDTQVRNCIVTKSVSPGGCLVDRVATYTTTVTFEGKTYTDTKTVNVPASGHVYGTPEFTWSSDYSSCQAKFTCVEGDDTQVLDCVVSHNITNATCTVDGLKTHTATVEFKGSTYTDVKTEGVLASGHTYKVPEFIWGADSTTCKAKFVCEKSDDTQILDCVVSELSRVNPSCIGGGSITYQASVEFKGNTYTDTSTVPLDAKGHSYKAPVFEWSSDFESCQAKFECEKSDDIQILDCVVSKITTNATCTVDGLVTYTTKVTFKGTEYTDIKTKNIVAEGHSYGTPSFTWDSEYANCTAKFTCIKGDDTQVVDCSIDVSTVDATCIVDGLMTYTAKATFKGADYTDVKTKGVAAKGHKYNEPTFNWSADFSSCEAIFECEKSDDTQTLDCNISSIISNPNCTDDGSIVYTAKATFKGAKYTDNKTKVLPATGHSYVAPEFIWSANYSSCKAKFTCSKNDDTKVLDCVVSHSTVDSTCAVDGLTTHTANIIFEGNPYSDVKTECILAAGHSYSAPEFIWSSDYSSCKAKFTCLRNDDTQIIDCGVSSTTINASCTQNGSITYVASVEFNGVPYSDEKVKVLHQTGHSYLAPEFIWSVDYNTCDAVFKCVKNDDSKTMSCSISKVVTSPKCTEDGNIEYTASVDFIGTHYSDVKNKPIDETGHNYFAPEFVWESDYSGCQAKFTCIKNDDTKILDCSVSVVTNDSNCVSDGAKVYTASVSFNGVDYTDVKSVPIPATGHAYKPPVFDWNDDYTVCKAKFSCQRNDDAQVVNCTIITVVDEPTCTKDGGITYTATAKFNGVSYTDSKAKALDKTGHSYKAPSFKWGMNYESCKATFECVKSDDTQVLDCIVTSSTTKSTCLVVGKVNYVAKIAFNNTEYEDTKFIDLELAPCIFGDWYVTRKPTYTKLGEKRRDCIVCDNFELDNLDKLEKLTKISGVVKDKDGNPLANYKVELHSVPRITYTNASGVFEFVDVEVGSHTLKIFDKNNGLVYESAMVLDFTSNTVNDSFLDSTFNVSKVIDINSIGLNLDGVAISGESTTNEESATKETTEKEATEEYTTLEETTKETTTKETTTKEESTKNETTAKETTTIEETTEESTTKEILENTTTIESTTEESTKEDTTTEEIPITESTTKEETTTKEITKEEDTTEEFTTEETTKEETTTTESTTKEETTKEVSTTEEYTTEESTKEETTKETTKETTTKEKITTEENTTKETVDETTIVEETTEIQTTSNKEETTSKDEVTNEIETTSKREETTNEVEKEEDTTSKEETTFKKEETTKAIDNRPETGDNISLPWFLILLAVFSAFLFSMFKFKKD